MEYQEMKNRIQTEDYRFLYENEHLKNRLMFLGLGGSYAYGTNIEGSDLDIRGAALNSKEEILLGRDFEQVIDENTDTTVYSFMKIVQLLTDANPNTLEILFLKPDQYLYMSELGKELISKRHLFLSKKVLHTFGGYAKAQLRRLDNKTMKMIDQSAREIHILNTVSNASYMFREKYTDFPEDALKLYIDRSNQVGYDTEIYMDMKFTHYPLRDYAGMILEMQNMVKEYGKVGKRASHAILHQKVNKHAMHLVRLMNCCIDILSDGDFCTYREKDHDLLMDIRNGKYMGEDNQLVPAFFELVSDLENQMNHAAETTCLPDKSDVFEINKLICHVNELVISGK